IEGVPAGGRGGRVGEGSLDVHQRVAVGEVLSGVDVEVISPEHVVEGEVVRQVAGISRQAQGEIVDDVRRDVAARHVVSEVAAGAQAAQKVRRMAGEGLLQMIDVERGQLRLSGRPSRHEAGNHTGQQAVDQDVPQIDGLHRVASEVDVEV